MDYHKNLVNKLKKNVTIEDLFKIILSFLNSPFQDFLLTFGRPRSPKGHFSVDQDLLELFKIPRVNDIKKDIFEDLLNIIKNNEDSIKINEKIIEIYKVIFNINDSEIQLINDLIDEL